MIPYRAIAAVIALAAIIAGGAWTLHRYEQAGYERGRDEALAEYTAAALKASQAARQREQALRETITQTQKEADHEKARLRTRLAAALDSLRNRPERPAGGDVPADSSPIVACTGASLFRADAEFLVREAARADQLRADLQACQEAYDSAREAMKATP
jgi:hypothetical protein